MENKKEFLKIDSYINDIASSGRINSFYPQMISRKLNIPIDITMLELKRCSDCGKLNLRYEIRCLDDFNTIKIVDSIEDILNTKIECDSCGDEFTVTYSNIYPKFYIDEDFRSMCKKKV